MTDVFGNYVIQKFFEYGTPEQKSTLAQKVSLSTASDNCSIKIDDLAMSYRFYHRAYMTKYFACHLIHHNVITHKII